MRLITRTCIVAGAVWSLAGVTFVPAPSAVAGPFSEVPSAFDPGDSLDINISLDYGLDIKRAAIKREFVGFDGTLANDPIPQVKDLVYKSARHTLTPKLELGIFTDLSLSIALPLIVSDSRSLELDQRETPCIFPGGTEDPTCIDRSNSTTINDGLLPSTGFDADNPGGPGFTDGALLFRGPGRAGVDQVHLGMSWAPMNQQRDDTKPTWKLGAEARLAIGKEMKLDPSAPGSETGVGRGVHEVHIWTSISKHMGWAEPYVQMWWVAPFGTTDDSAFRDLGFGMQRGGSQQRAGTQFGFEAIAINRPAKKQRFSIDIGARLEARFEGRAYSEMWEVFQFAGSVDRAGPLVLDEDPVTEGVQALDFPGVSKIENHMRYGGHVGLHTHISDKVRIDATFEILGTQGHIITFEDAGQDLPTCDAGQAPPGCEIDQNGLVNPNSAEVNPAHVTLIDLVGQRYYADNIVNYMFTLDARFLF